MITSPGLAAAVVCPGKVPFLTAKLLSCRVAMLYLPVHRKNAGLAVWAVTLAGELVTPEWVTVTDIVPVPASGQRALIWVGLTKETYAGLPPTETVTSSRLVGSFPLTIALSQVLVADERL